MRILFDRKIFVAYGLVTFEATDAEPASQWLLESRGGQRNGLCGARVPAALVMVTGLHTGEVPVRAEYHDADPGEPDPSWEDVVEVSIELAGESYALTAMDDGEELDLPERGPHRARWCARGMDAGHHMDTPDDGESAPDSYLLQLWRADGLQPDAVLRGASAYAAYWHGVAAETEPPPPPPTPEELAEQERREREAELLAEQEQERLRELWWWGGRRPSSELSTWGLEVSQLARRDRDLLDEIAALTPRQQRDLAVWAVRRAFERAGLLAQPWAAEVLDLLSRGEPVPPMWHDWSVLDLMFRRGPGHTVEHRVTVTTGATATLSSEWPAIDPRAAAVVAVQGAADQHPGRAAALAVEGLSQGAENDGSCSAEVRAAMRGLAD